jgi:general L-amino acid transport system permease protein
MWRSERFRQIVYQLALILAIGAVGGYLVHNLLHNLHSRGITIGFSYLRQEAGFDISEKLIDYDAAGSYGRAFIVGLLNTLYVSACAIVVATLLGVSVGIARLSPNWLLARLAGGYIEWVRNVPLILQLLMAYGILTELLPPVSEAWRVGVAYFSQRGVALPWYEFGVGWSLPELSGFEFEGGKTISPEFIALFVGLSIYTAAFIAEIVRGGIQSVPRGQTDAAQALGLSRAQRLRLVVLPQALRVIIPPLTSQYLNLTKNSSLAVAIGYPDLVSVSTTTLNQTGQAIEAIALMMAVYLAISLTISGLMNLYNARVRLVER